MNELDMIRHNKHNRVNIIQNLPVDWDINNFQGSANGYSLTSMTQNHCLIKPDCYKNTTFLLASIILFTACKQPKATRDAIKKQRWR